MCGSIGRTTAAVSTCSVGPTPGGSGIASFECSIDSGTYTTCTSPHTTATLADGPHTFAVRAIDNAGNTDPTPATTNWTIDTTPPAPTTTNPVTGTMVNGDAFVPIGQPSPQGPGEAFSQGAADVGHGRPSGAPRVAPRHRRP